jgi:putative thiamine transport system ATP-binding protein
MTVSDKGLHLRHLRIALAGKTLVQLDVAIKPGEILSVMGPSGSGKSTLLAVIAGIAAPGFVTTGQVLLDGRDIALLPPHERHVGILQQDDLLFPHLSVAGNLAFALPESLRERRVRRARVEEALAQADLAGFGARAPATLSGGQRARVAVLRMLLAEPRALLLDEPFSSLDQDLRAQFRQFVFGTARERKLPVLLVTHEREDAELAGGPVVAPDGLQLVCS